MFLDTVAFASNRVFPLYIAWYIDSGPLKSKYQNNVKNFKPVHVDFLRGHPESAILLIYNTS